VAVLAVAACGVLGLAGTAATVGALKLYAADLPSLDDLNSNHLPQATRIYDRNGTLIEELYRENRTVVRLARISPMLRMATISTEDRTFYQHQGVDYRRVAIAFAYDMTHRSSAQGASTISQQVIKDSVLADPAKTVDRKIRELMLAEEMERRYTKDEILELYLNTIFYGNGAFGAEAAAETYFGRHAADLDLAQAAFLAGLPQQPSVYNPFGSAEQRAAALGRWRQVLDAMVVTGDATPAAASDAAAEDLLGQMAQHRKDASSRDPRTAHFVDFVVQDLVASYGERALYEGGLQVTTTLDLQAQLAADAAVKAAVGKFRAKGANTGALLAIDPAGGGVLAMVGSADYTRDDISGQINLTTAFRQPGSSFKPYTYAAAFERGSVTAATRVDDQDDTIGGARFSDWDGKREGWIPVRQALVESRNLPALWTYKNLGAGPVLDLTQRLGVTIRGDTGNLTATIGSVDVRMIDHVAAFAAFDNGGYRVVPRAVNRVVDGSGRLLESHAAARSGYRVMSPELAYLVTDILKGPPQQYLGTSGKPVAAKSGTTEAWSGAWWVGYTPDLAVGAFMAHVNPGEQCTSGFARLAPKAMQVSGWVCPTDAIWGEDVGQAMWKPFVQAYYQTHAWPQPWAQPEGIVKRTVCKLDGNLAGDKIPADQRYDEIFIRDGGEPAAACGSAPPPGSQGVASPAPTPSATPPPR
jgi:penicillin-binding protein 1A